MTTKTGAYTVKVASSLHKDSKATKQHKGLGAYSAKTFTPSMLSGKAPARRSKRGSAE
jgi:hypothetical protein